MSSNRYLYHLYNYGDIVNFWGVLSKLDASYHSKELMIETTDEHISHLKTLKNLDELGQYIIYLLANRSQPNLEFIEEMFKFMRRRGGLEHYTGRLFHIARTHNLINTFSFHMMMDALYHRGKLNARISIGLLNEAIEKGHADSRLFHRALASILKMPTPDVMAALEVFKSARMHGCADEAAYDILLKIIDAQTSDDGSDYRNAAEEIYFGMLEIPALVERRNQLRLHKSKLQSEQPVYSAPDDLPKTDHQLMQSDITKSTKKTVCEFGLFTKIVVAATTITAAATAYIMM